MNTGGLKIFSDKLKSFVDWNMFSLNYVIYLTVKNHFISLPLLFIGYLLTLLLIIYNYLSYITVALFIFRNAT